jgi:hypothetical protein
VSTRQIHGNALSRDKDIGSANFRSELERRNRHGQQTFHSIHMGYEVTPSCRPIWS